ncbi:MAG TPA: hypothetical protein VF062_22430 [Candidatus Limnocylindrales bacterium]
MSETWPAPLLSWVQHNPGLQALLREALAAAWEHGRQAAINDPSDMANPWIDRCQWPCEEECTSPRARGLLCADHAELATALLLELPEETR